MNPLSAALEARRQGAVAPKQGAPDQAEGEQGIDLKGLVASLEPEVKMQLMQMLQNDLSGKKDDGSDPSDPSKIEDDAGQTKVTSGEQQALAAELPSQADNEPDDDDQPQGLRGRISASIDKHFGKRK